MPVRWSARSVRDLLIVTLIIVVCLRIAAHRQVLAEAAAPAGSSAAQPDYHPSFGDLMTMAVQPRHIKLGLAGSAGNWTYASYELSELRNAFARIARTIPRYNGADTPALFTAMTDEPLTSVSNAIKDHDMREFRRAYGQLTTACNACHISQRHAFVVIRVPTAYPYEDQNLRSANP